MIKNADILAKLEKESLVKKNYKNWHKKADALYKTAMSLNPESVKKGGQDHLEMLIGVRKKFGSLKKQMSGVK